MCGEFCHECRNFCPIEFGYECKEKLGSELCDGLSDAGLGWCEYWREIVSGNEPVCVDGETCYGFKM